MFSAFRVFDEDGRISGRLVQASLDELSAGAVVIKTAFSSVNYKDALAGTGAGKIMRRVLKAVILGKDPGDISTIEDEGSVEEAREAWEQMRASVATGR